MGANARAAELRLHVAVVAHEFEDVFDRRELGVARQRDLAALFGLSRSRSVAPDASASEFRTFPRSHRMAAVLPDHSR
jgi:hypothetical protein